MTRRIALVLGAKTTRRHCRDCPSRLWGACKIFGRLYQDSGKGLPYARHRMCKAAELPIDPGGIPKDPTE